jgi:large subunit ribosomal protein L23
MGLFNIFKKKKDEKEASKKDAKVVVEEKVDKKEITQKVDSPKPIEIKKKKDKKEDSIASKVSTDKEKKDVKRKKTTQGKAYSVLLKSLVSEKAAAAETGGVYTFIVDKNANKFNIKQSVKEAYGIMPTKVRVINVEGKRVRFGQRRGKRSDWKKAIVTLPKGKTINIHEGV